jgi:hypothetical protein
MKEEGNEDVQGREKGPGIGMGKWNENGEGMENGREEGVRENGREGVLCIMVGFVRNEH